VKQILGFWSLLLLAAAASMLLAYLGIPWQINAAVCG